MLTKEIIKQNFGTILGSSLKFSFLQRQENNLWDLAKEEKINVHLTKTFIL